MLLRSAFTIHVRMPARVPAYGKLLKSVAMDSTVPISRPVFIQVLDDKENSDHGFLMHIGNFPIIYAAILDFHRCSYTTIHVVPCDFQVTPQSFGRRLEYS